MLFVCQERLLSRNKVDKCEYAELAHTLYKGRGTFMSMSSLRMIPPQSQAEARCIVMTQNVVAR